MPQLPHLPVPSETQLWVSWVVALVAAVALFVMVVAGVAVFATAL